MGLIQLGTSLANKEQNEVVLMNPSKFQNLRFLSSLFLVLSLLGLPQTGLADIINYDCSQGPWISEAAPAFLKQGKPLKEFIKEDFQLLFERMKYQDLKFENNKSLEDFIQEITNTTSYVMPAKDGIYGSGSINFRQEAAYYPSCIMFAEDLLIPDKANRYLLIHEALGANGYQDQNFEITSLLMMPIKTLKALNIQIPPLTQKTVQAQNKPKEQPLLMADSGGTVVGGGGDTLLLAMKSQIFENMANVPLVDAQFKPIDITPAEQKKFIDFIQNSTIDYFDQDFGAFLSIANGFNQHMIALGFIKKPFLIKMNSGEEDLKPHLLFNKSDWLLLNQLALFLNSNMGSKYLDADFLTNPNAASELTGELTQMVENNFIQDTMLRHYFEVESKLTNNQTDKRLYKKVIVINLVNHMSEIIIKDQANLKKLFQTLPLRYLEKLPQVVLMSQLYADMNTTQGAIDMYIKLKNSGELEKLKLDFKKIIQDFSPKSEEASSPNK